jgi:hypothetical protein
MNADRDTNIDPGVVDSRGFPNVAAACGYREVVREMAQLNGRVL